MVISVSVLGLLATTLGMVLPWPLQDLYLQILLCNLFWLSWVWHFHGFLINSCMLCHLLPEWNTFISIMPLFLICSTALPKGSHLWLHCWPSHCDIILLPGVLQPHILTMNILIYVGSSAQSVCTVNRFTVRSKRQGNDIAGGSTRDFGSRSSAGPALDDHISA